MISALMLRKARGTVAAIFVVIPIYKFAISQIVRLFKYCDVFTTHQLHAVYIGVFQKGCHVSNYSRDEVHYTVDSLICTVSEDLEFYNNITFNPHKRALFSRTAQNLFFVCIIFCSNLNNVRSFIETWNAIFARSSVPRKCFLRTNGRTNKCDCS